MNALRELSYMFAFVSKLGGVMIVFVGLALLNKNRYSVIFSGHFRFEVTFNSAGRRAFIVICQYCVIFTAHRKTA
jgi:hypothetical protein